MKQKITLLIMAFFFTTTAAAQTTAQSAAASWHPFPISLYIDTSELADMGPDSMLVKAPVAATKIQLDANYFQFGQATLVKAKMKEKYTSTQITDINAALAEYGLDTMLAADKPGNKPTIAATAIPEIVKVKADGIIKIKLSATSLKAIMNAAGNYGESPTLATKPAMDHYVIDGIAIEYYKLPEVTKAFADSGTTPTAVTAAPKIADEICEILVWLGDYCDEQSIAASPN